MGTRARSGAVFRTHGSGRAVGAVMALVGLGIVVLPAQTAAATTWTVTNCNDSGIGSLRQAVASAAAGDIVTLPSSLSSCSPITLTSGPVDLTDSGTIVGPGANVVAVSASFTSSVFEVPRGVTVNITGLTIEDGSAGTGNGGGIDNAGTVTLIDSTVSHNSGSAGGGIDSTGTVTLNDSTVSGNKAAFGGGIYNTGTVTLNDSTVSANSASTLSGDSTGETFADGGGVFNTGTLTVTDSTLSGNSATGGFAYGGGIDNAGSVTLTNSTLSGNQAEGGTATYGGAIDNGGTASITNSTLAGNVAESGSAVSNAGSATVRASIVAGAGGPPAGCNGPVSDGGYNIGDDGTCFTAATSVSASAALDGSLGPLADNRGPTETVALSSPSPAIGQVPASDCPSTDQRGVPRTAPCDIGAYNTAPPSAIARFRPAKGPVGKRVVIHGTNLSGVTAVTFNGTPAPVKIDTKSEIITSVPAGATTGAITVVTLGGGPATTVTAFRVISRP
jgi:hypothetical protein